MSDEDQIRTIVETIIRPLVQADGGDVEFVGYEDDIATLRLSKACGGCPGAPTTQSEVIEPALKKGLGRDVIVEILRAP